MRKLTFIAIALLALSCSPKKQDSAGLVLPTKAQVEWQSMEMNMFCHFGPNTFSGREWGDGTETEDMFNPSNLDCRQWAAVAKAAGFKGIIITAKHHDGFCLWPNPVSKHTVAQSSWKDGKGDVLAELSEACKEYGLKFGVYISPWDRFDPNYGTPEYNNVFVKTLQSALGSYGEVYEQWFDGACGEGPNGKKQEYDWEKFDSTVFALQPNAVIFSNVGPGCRWVGNERGEAGRTCWSTMTIGSNTPSNGFADRTLLNTGDPNGEDWVPAETDVSIRPGWFWKERENGKVKSVQDLLGIYYSSVGRNSLLLLNVPPDTTGRINPIDSTRLIEFRSALNEIFANNLLCKGCAGIMFRAQGPKHQFQSPQGQNVGEQASPIYVSKAIKLKKGDFNRIVLSEDISQGQRVAAFSIEALVDGEWREIASETTIGYKRIVLVPRTSARAIRLNILETKAEPIVKIEGVYLDEIYKENN